VTTGVTKRKAVFETNLLTVKITITLHGPKETP